MNRRAMDPKRPIRFCLALLGAAAMLTLSACGGAAEEPPLQGAAIGGDFKLIDKTGKTVRAADFKGRYTALYFGYTFCPDVCPLDVQVLMQGYRGFAKAHPDLAAKVTPLFVTIDPARDKPEIVGQFTAHFGKELIGLTGSDAEIAQIAKSYGVYYKKGEGSGPNAYLMDHSRAAYLMGPDGQPIALLPVDANGAAVAAELAKWVH